LYTTDGAQGAARGAGVGAGIFKDFEEAFSGLKKLKIVEPDINLIDQYTDVYGEWKNKLEMMLK
jgi:xylulokinase